MGTDTKIPWCEHTWNPWYCCTRVSEGCAFCYIERWAQRAGRDAFGGPIPAKNRMHLLRSRKHHAGDFMFVCSLSDFFHEDCPDQWRADALAVMSRRPELTFLLLTKRPEVATRFVEEEVKGRIANAWAILHEQRNVWLGVTAENQARAGERIPELLSIEWPGKKFVSIEPCLSAIDLTPWLGGGMLASRTEDDHDTASGRGGVSDRAGRGVADRQTGSDLADCNPPRRPLARRGDADHEDSPPTRGASGSIRLPSSAGHVCGEEASRVRAPSGVEALQGKHTSGPDDQSQERDQGRQPTGKPGTGDLPRATDSCAPCLEARADGPMGREERDGETIEEASPGDHPATGRRRTPSPNRARYGCSDADGFTDCAPGVALSWVIQGGESGPNHRPFDLDWARSLRDQCQDAGVPFFLKQTSGNPPKKMPMLDGKVWAERPARD